MNEIAVSTVSQKPKTLATRLLTSRAAHLYSFFCASIVVRMRKPMIIGVTGTAGKTTTVTMVATVLSDAAAAKKLGPVWHTLENMNDYDGFPLTLLGHHQWMTGWRRLKAFLLMPFRALALSFFKPYPKVLVLEYGTDHEGQIPRLVKLAPPAIGVITTIGPAHLDGLKTIEGVVKEKGTLISRVPPSGLVILGADHEHVNELQARTQAPVVLVAGRGPALSREIARIIGSRLGLSPECVEAALESVPKVMGRLDQFDVCGMTVIDDTFNANPVSMRLGLDTMHEGATTNGQRRVALLGAMAELGEESERYHREIGAHARQRADLVVGVGDMARYYAADHWFASSADCVDNLQALVRDGDYILIKGSKSMKMALVAKALRAFAPTAAASADKPN